MLIDSENAHENWLEAHSLWNRVYNWSHYKTTERELLIQIKSLLIYLWNEKDWLKEEHQSKTKLIEKFINKSTYIKIVGDLANKQKHRKLKMKPRSSVKETNYHGRVTTGRDVSRKLHYLDMSNGEFVEIMTVLRGAIDEFGNLRLILRDKG